MKNTQERINSRRTEVEQTSHLEDRMVSYLPGHHCRTLLQKTNKQTNKKLLQIKIKGNKKHEKK